MPPPRARPLSALAGTCRTLPAFASLSLPVNWDVMYVDPPASAIVARSVARSHASSPMRLGRTASPSVSKSATGTFTGLPPSTFSDTISRGTSWSTTLAGPSGVCTVAFCLGRGR